MAAYQPRKQREHNLAVSPSGGNCNQAARACRAVSRTRPPARPTKSVVPETLRHSRPRYPGPHSSKHAFVSGGHRARGRGAASPTLSAGVKKQIRGGEVFDRTVWPKRCRTGNRHHRESSRETNARFRDRLLAENWGTDFSLACWRHLAPAIPSYQSFPSIQNSWAKISSWFCQSQ